MTKDRHRGSSLKYFYFTVFLFIVCLILFGTSTILLKAYSNSLAEQKQRAEAKIKELELLNENIYKQIEELDTENNLNIDAFLKKTKLQKNLGNIVEIPPDNP